MTKRELEPISPGRAKEMYLEARKREVSQSALDGYHYRLKHFIRWCNEVEGIGIRSHTEIRYGAIYVLKMDGHEETEP